MRILVLYIVTFATIFSVNYKICESVSPPKVRNKLIIIGAGVSGIGAAAQLLKKNFSDFIILEASDRYGGRLLTAPFGDYIVDYGCQWVHGQEGNIVYEIVSPHNVVFIQNFHQHIQSVKGPDSKINITEFNGLFEDALSILDDNEGKIECNCTVDSYLIQEVDKITKNKNVSKESKEAILDIMKKVTRALDGTEDLTKVGSRGNTEYTVLNGSDTVAWKNGYKTFLDIVLGKYETKKLPVLEFIRYNHEVINIDYTGDEVSVLCEDGSSYIADHVLSTVSLGVLKHSANTMFKPALPERKQSAIDTLGFDLVDKIYVHFDKRWWPLVSEFSFSFLWSDEDKTNFHNKTKHGDWLTEITYFHTVENQPRLLEGWVCGDTARKVENLSDSQVLEGVMELFHNFLDDKYNITKPINITRSQWYNNKFVRGSYSFRTYNSDKLGITGSDLAKPVLHNNSKPVVLFAGEATHDHYFSTVHGAYETGLREANRILSFVS